MAYRSFKSDYENGLSGEVLHKERIQTFFGMDLIKDTNKRSAFDFHNEAKTTYVELKTRTINHDRWPTTVIGASKVEHARRGLKDDPSKRYYFVWAFKDGLFYLEYTEDGWKDFECGDFQRHHRLDKVEVPHQHYFIPYSALQRIQ